MISRREDTLRAGLDTQVGGWRRHMTPRMRWVLIISAVVFAVLILWLKFVPWLFMNVIMSKSDFIQPQAVSTAHAVSTPWQSQVRAVGTLHAVQGADLAPEVAGIVTKIGFKPGDDVAAGQVLVQLRDDSDRAQLAALRATAEQNTLTYKRNVSLSKANAISPQAFDVATANMKSAAAQAEAQSALVEKKAIRAPFSGRVGIRQVDVGQYVNAGTVVVTLQQLDPIDIDFTVPQATVALVELSAQARIVHVIGTTGIGEDEVELIIDQAGG